MNRRKFILGTATVVGVSGAGAVAFTSASVAREVNIEVDTDDDAIVGLSAGNTGAASQEDGVLVIDTSVEQNGLNLDSNFTFGQEETVETDHLFALTNNSSDEQDFELGFDTQSADGVATFGVYDGDNSEVGSFNGEDTVSVTLNEAETVYMIMTVDTDGLAENDDITGDFTIDVVA